MYLHIRTMYIMSPQFCSPLYTRLIFCNYLYLIHDKGKERTELKRWLLYRNIQKYTRSILLNQAYSISK